MRILLYSDLHISKTSSILPLTSANPKYSYRQNMIIETGKYLANLVNEEKPDMIINLGDTFDQHTITSYDSDVASEFFKQFNGFKIPHLVLVGNHEMINQDYNVVSILDNIENIIVVKSVGSDTISVSSLEGSSLGTDVTLGFLPYQENNNLFSLPESDFLFSHIDVYGSKIRQGVELQNGIKPSELAKYKLVFNGHIHKASILKNIVNVGSITTHSFADDTDSVPQCYIFDTDTLKLKTFKPTICPLFRKFEIKENISELEDYLKSLNKDYKYILQVICSYTDKEIVKNLLEQQPFVLAHRLNVKVDKAEKTKENLDIKLETNINVKGSFEKFLDTVDLKFNREFYLDILNEIRF